MKQRGSSEGGGAAWDVEPERCRLAGTFFLGAIVVMEDLKSEKKNGTQEEQETMGSIKTGGGKKMANGGI